MQQVNESVERRARAPILTAFPLAAQRRHHPSMGDSAEDEVISLEPKPRSEASELASPMDEADEEESLLHDEPSRAPDK